VQGVLRKLVAMHVLREETWRQDNQYGNVMACLKANQREANSLLASSQPIMMPFLMPAKPAAGASSAAPIPTKKGQTLFLLCVLGWYACCWLSVQGMLRMHVSLQDCHGVSKAWFAGHPRVCQHFCEAHTDQALHCSSCQMSGMLPAMGSVCCTAVSGGKSRKRSAASAASWEDEDLVQDAGDALDLTEDDTNVSTVRNKVISVPSNMRSSKAQCTQQALLPTKALLFQLMMLNVQWLLLPACVCLAHKCTAIQYAATNQPIAPNVCHSCDIVGSIVSTCGENGCISMPGPAGHSFACNAPRQ
jgi:hypothetical protein